MRARMELERERYGLEQRESIGDLLVDLASQSATLVKEEVSLAQQELKESANRVKPSITTIAFGIAGAALSAMALVAASILALSKVIEPWLAALAVGGGLALIAAVTISMGFSKLKQARVKPDQTIASLEENKEWLKETTS